MSDEANPPNPDKWRFYRDSNGEWRWKRIAQNNREVGASSEGYKSKDHCIENAIRHGFPETYPTII